METKKGLILALVSLVFVFGVLSVVFAIDTDPIIIDINPVTTPTNSNTQTITGTFTGINIVNITVNGVLATINGSTYSADVTLVEGSNIITATAIDLAGNTRTDTVSIFLDTIAPTLNSTFIEPTYPIPNDQVNIKATFKDDNEVSRVEIKWCFRKLNENLCSYSSGGDSFNYVEMSENNGIFSSFTPAPKTGFGEGYVEYRLRPYDLFGNHNSTGITENPFYFTYDDTPPITITNILNGQFITSDTSVTLNATDPDLDNNGDNNGKYEPSEVKFITYQIDNNPAANYTAPFRIKGADESYTITFFSVDNAGNPESEKTITVNLDNTIPIVEDNYQFNNSWVNLPQQVTINSSDGTGSGIKNITYCLNEVCTTVNTDNVTIDLPNNTETNVKYYATDKLGQQSKENSFVVKIDLIKPVTKINSPVLGSWQNTDFQVDVTDTDTGGSELSLCEYQVKVSLLGNLIISKDWTSRNCNSPVLITVGEGKDCYAEGKNICQINVRAYDNAKNRGITKWRKFSVDFTIPTITDDYTNDGVWVNSLQTVTLNPKDTGGSGISSVKTCKGSVCTPSIPLDSPYQLSFSESQDTIVRYQVFDVAENPSLIGEFNVSIDLEVPSVTITSNSSTDKMDYFVVKADVSDAISGLKEVSLVLKNSSEDVILNVPMILVLNEDYEYLLRMWELVAGNYTLEVTAEDNAGNVNLTTQTFEVRENVAPSRIFSTNNKVNVTTGGTVSFNFDVVVRNNGKIVFGIDDVAGLSPHFLNAIVSNGTTNVSVGKGINFIGAGILTLKDSNLDILNVQGSFTLYLDFPKDMIPGNYPINYFIDVA